MSLILVAEKESRYIERIRDALLSEGWRVQIVAGTREALAAAASEPPQLALISSDLEGAETLFRTFSRKTGGPGVVALVPERETLGNQPPSAADDLVSKPFTDQQLRMAVRRGLAPKTSADEGQPGATAPELTQLTSHDIFGDLVAEVERELTDHGPAAAAEAATPEPPPAPPPSPAQAEVRAEPAPPRAGRRSAEIDRALEETLSGLRRVEGERSSARRSRRTEEADVEALLSETLSGLDLPRGRGKDRPARPPAPAPATEPQARRRPSEEIDLRELEAIARPQPKSRPPEPPVAGPPAEAATPFTLDEVAEEEPTAPPAPEPPTLDLEFPDLDFALEDEPLPELPEALLESLDAPEPLLPSVEVDAAEPMVPEIQPPAPPARQFGQYTLLERIAVGGMAEVWKARMTGVEGFQKTVAIKKILPHLVDNSEFVNMFIDEAKLAAQLNHPNIIHIYDLGKIAEDFYIAMEYVAGRNLRALLNDSRRKNRPIPVGLAVLIASRLASALDYAHRKKDFDNRGLDLVHRDVSPQNVLISNEGDIKLCDFGIVKAAAKASQTQMGALKGKLQYMSPEQAWGKPVDSRSDIFSLGALLFEMLAGQRLFAGDNEISVLEAVRQCHIRGPREINPAVPQVVELIVLQALKQDPDQRYQTAGQMQQELEKILYSMRPAPSQADLADYLQQLEEAAEAEPPVDEKPAPVAAGGKPKPAAAAAVGAESPREPPPKPPAPRPEVAEFLSTSPPRPEVAAGPTPARKEVVVAAIASDESELELEEGGSRGRKLLIFLIVVALLAGAGAAVYWWYQRSGMKGIPALPGFTTEDPGAEGAESPPSETPPPETETTPDGEPSPGADSAPEASVASGLTFAASTPAPEVPELWQPAEPPGGEPRRAAPRSILERAAPASAPEGGNQALKKVEPPPKRPPPAPPQRLSTAETPKAAPPTVDIEVAAETREASPATAPPPAAAVEPPTASEPAAAGPAPIEQALPRQRATTDAEPAAATEAAPKPAPDPGVEEGDLVGPGPGVVPPVLVSIEKPKYPPLAKRMRVEGDVVLFILVDEKGRVLEAGVQRGVRQAVGINEAALEAARTAKYDPATRDGVRVKMWTTLRIPFKL